MERRAWVHRSLGGSWRSLPAAAIALVCLLVLGGLGSAGASPLVPSSSTRAGGTLSSLAAPRPLSPRAGSGGNASACLLPAQGVVCGVQPDEPVVNLLANDSGSGARVRWIVDLPGAGTNPGAVEGAFWTGLWVTGAPCSLDGASYLEVVLYPPDSPAVVPSSPDWVAQVPVTDLAPGGSCDPLCQNASASTTIDGVAACEDNIVRGGGWAPSPATGRFSPGDALMITLWGNVSAPATPLDVWVNDTSDAGASAHWQYGANATITGNAVAPRYPRSAATDLGWLTPSDAAFGDLDCPAVSGPSSCLTYDGPVAHLAESAQPVVQNATFWNATTASWQAFPWIATASSSGGCSGAAGLAHCADVSSDGGTGAYPALAVVPSGSGSGWELGSPTAALGSYGGSSAEFTPNGTATTEFPALLSVPSTFGWNGNATLNVTLADPRGLWAVRASTYWCGSSGFTLPVATNSLRGTRANTTLTLPVGSENGTLIAWVQEEAPGAAWSPAVRVSVAMHGGGGGSCTVPSPLSPWFGVSNVTAVSGGYRLDWAENSSAVRGFVLTITNATELFQETIDLGVVSNDTVTGLNASDHYTVSLEAVSLDGANASQSVASAPFPGAPLALDATGGSPTLWSGPGTTAVGVSIAGGTGPFTIVATLPNGTTVATATPNRTASLDLPIAAAGDGFVVATVKVTDATNVTTAPAPVLWDVWTGPLAPNVTVTAGEAYFEATWPAPSSPVAAVTNYTLYATSNASLAPAAASVGFDNTTRRATVGGVEVWNTTNGSALVPWANNVTAFVLVVPHDTVGPGYANAVPANATPFPLALVGPIEGGPGGSAPYTANYSTVVETGTNDPIDEAVYSFPGFEFVTANVTRTNATTVYVNATATVDTVGLDLVVLHVSDLFAGVLIGTTEILVGAGAPPTVTAQANPSPAYVGVAVNFSAEATGAGPFAYNWTFGDGANSSGASVLHAYSAPGTYTARVTVVDNGTGGSASVDVVELVYALPRVAISDGAGPNGSGSFAFHATMIGGAGNGSFVWTFGDGAVGRGENVTHDYLAPGVYTVGVVATDASLRTSHANLTLDVLLSSGTSSGGSGADTFTPLADGLLVAAVVGWAVAIVLLLRRAPPDEADEDDDDG
jgi:PKD repeat protein